MDTFVDIGGGCIDVEWGWDGGPGRSFSEVAWHYSGLGLRWPELDGLGSPTGVLLLPSWIIVLVVIPLAAVAWRASRRPSAGMCEVCGYSLRGNLSGICPECGTKIAPNEKSGDPAAHDGARKAVEDAAPDEDRPGR